HPHHFAEHGVGSQPVASACFLNCALRISGFSRYTGSSTIDVTIIIDSPPGSWKTSNHSVNDACALYGTPFFLSSPGFRFVVITRRLRLFCVLGAPAVRLAIHAAVE